MKQSLIEATDRFVQLAFDKNPNIKSPSDFNEALFSAFDSPRGQNATGQFNEEELMHFFNSQECQTRLRENLSEAELQKVEKEVEKGEYEVIRAVPKGERIKPSQVKVVYTPKKISVSPYQRSGKSISAYNKGYSKWTAKEVRFLQVRKARKVSPMAIVNEYNRHFSSARSSSSLKTKIYRV